MQWMPLSQLIFSSNKSLIQPLTDLNLFLCLLLLFGCLSRRTQGIQCDSLLLNSEAFKSSLFIRWKYHNSKNISEDI
ncbi:hypothetical protein L6164_008016 [Bauhinia variegata]|uniref:Uncharacterized protein n=1 Tax=Bauhinia variegata TaxID=167791 RepID=A0ACB9PFI9_BAUVA|nr:hypothetical protein L6164_008016 [Bauhinia variegata]